MSAIRLDCYGATDVGRVRKANEDSIMVDAERQLLIVADGVGGAAGGKTASSMTVEIVHRYMAEEIDRLRETGAGDGPTVRERMSQRLQLALENASATVYSRGQTERGLRGMGTTAVVLEVVGAWAVIAHVGDSRVYLVRDGVLHQVTEDHTLARMMLARGAITPEEAVDYHSNVIARAVGLQPTVKADLICFEVLPDDTFVLCSDGVTDPVSATEILEISSGSAPRAVAHGLIDRANQRGGPDNISAVVARVSGEAPLTPSVRMEIKVELLRHVSLFRELTFQEGARMLTCINEHRLDSGLVLFREGDPGDAFCIVAEGAVEISQRGVALTVIERGGHFGELALLGDGVRSATARARGPTTVLTIGREPFMWLVRNDHSLATKLLWGFVTHLGDRVKTLSAQLTGGAGN